MPVVGALIDDTMGRNGVPSYMHMHTEHRRTVYSPTKTVTLCDFGMK